MTVPPTEKKTPVYSLQNTLQKAVVNMYNELRKEDEGRIDKNQNYIENSKIIGSKYFKVYILC